MPAFPLQIFIKAIRSTVAHPWRWRMQIHFKLSFQKHIAREFFPCYHMGRFKNLWFIKSEFSYFFMLHFVFSISTFMYKLKYIKRLLTIELIQFKMCKIMYKCIHICQRCADTTFWCNTDVNLCDDVDTDTRYFPHKTNNENNSSLWIFSW